ncbi:hypothetical protein N7470_005905 [Penicillium chermesinum]|nr:hypothetical protein N7470_005905 [Penicillium chermesinum]
MALSNVLRSLFHSEFPTVIRHGPFHRPARPLRTAQYPRLFSSTVPTSSIKLIDNAQDITTEPQGSVPSDKPAEAIDFSPESSIPFEELMCSADSAKKSKDAKKKQKPNKGPENDKSSGANKNATKAYKAPKDNKKRELWKIQKEALKEKLSPDALDGIRHLHQTDPARFTTAVLAEEFKTSPEAIRRILKSKWTPSGAEVENRRKRWERRHDRIWSHKAELGLRPFVKRAAPFSDSQKLYKDE